MTRQRAKSAFREWSGPRPTPETVQMPPYGFRVPQKNASVHADPGSSGECRFNRVGLMGHALKDQPCISHERCCLASRMNAVVLHLA
jgi:hypothetical protein